ncbi:MAG: hypothetical protein BWX71_01271 [Deltaproteobacteria bacterium ADurb.Bin072]|nr:MAG: hypothetical protein BWX71_01271 [Deltaproteobacteria bacterium ADurb.Bin072]
MIDDHGVAEFRYPVVVHHGARMDGLHQGPLGSLDVNAVGDLVIALFLGDPESSHEGPLHRPWQIADLLGHAAVGDLGLPFPELLEEALDLLLIGPLLLGQRREHGGFLLVFRSEGPDLGLQDLQVLLLGPRGLVEADLGIEELLPRPVVFRELLLVLRDDGIDVSCVLGMGVQDVHHVEVCAFVQGYPLLLQGAL